MARFAYEKASRWMGTLFAGAFLGVAGLYFTMFFLVGSGIGDRIGGWSLVVGFFPLVVAVGTSWAITARLNRRRVQAVMGRLKTLGFRTVEKPTESERTEFAAPIIHLFGTLNLQKGAVGIQWLAVEQAGTSKVLIFEHQFVTGSGKTTQEHHHTVIAWPAGHSELGNNGLASAPWFFMAQFPRFLRRGYRDRELKQPEFADLTLVWTLLGDPATGARFLSAGVRRLLASSPKNEAWSVGTGWVCCAFEGTVDAENLDRFLAHGRGLLSSAGRA